MKATLYDVKGSKKSDIELPQIFSMPIREDITSKCFEAEKYLFLQPYSPYEEAGRRHSASGTISHKRHEWKGHYGKGISRTPRKTMWRRGTQFYWIGAEVSQTRGGRSVHAPSGLHRPRKINKRETKIALASALAATMNKHYLSLRYPELKEHHAGAVVESLPQKTKDLLAALRSIFGASYAKVLKQKSVRAGKGKRRGRKYKSSAGLLIVTGTGEKATYTGVDVRNAKQLAIRDVYPLGRLTLYTKKALEELPHVA